MKLMSHTLGMSEQMKTAYSYYLHYDVLNDYTFSGGTDYWFTNEYIEHYWPNVGSHPIIPSLAPDEFVFGLPNGTSGSFFLNHLGQWVIKSKSGMDLKVSVKTNVEAKTTSDKNIYLYNIDPATLKRSTISPTPIKRAIFAITVTDQLGYVYTFGNQDDAVEFTRGGRSQALPNNEDIVANAWHLTSIQSPKGNNVNFVFSRGLNQYVQHTIYPSSNYSSGGFVSNPFAQSGFSSQNSSPRRDFIQIVTPSYLSKINASSFTVCFNDTTTNELGYSYLPDGAASLMTGFISVNWPDLGIVGDPASPTGNLANDPTITYWYKLTGITISDGNGSTKEKFAFDYKDQSDSRLFLTDFRKKSLTADPDLVYSFKYNETQLPPYNTLSIDQWYFNNIIFNLEMPPSE